MVPCETRVGHSVFIFGIQAPAKWSATAVAQGLLLRNHHGLACLRMNGGVLGAYVHCEDAQRGDLDALLFDQVVNQHFVVALDEAVDPSYGHFEFLGQEGK